MQFQFIHWKRTVLVILTVIAIKSKFYVRLDKLRLQSPGCLTYLFTELQSK